MTMRRLTVALVLAGTLTGGAKTYEANWESLDSRPVPQWWTEAKFGIFIHWGLYSVPAYAPFDGKNVYACYAEWYQGRMIGDQGSTATQAFRAHHEKFYRSQPYANFGSQFTARFFEPAKWAELFRKAGAKYVVLTSKHHDGYALWPSPETPYYNSVAFGPGRDLCGELTAAVKAAGLKSGFYYSLMEYANPAYRAAESNKTLRAWSDAMNIPQMKELVENYKADIIWPDGEWNHTDEDWKSVEFLQWLYNESSMKDTIVADDRWGKGCRGKHGGHYTTEYGHGDEGVKAAATMHPWEECQGLGRSFGYNRFETTSEYKDPTACVRTLADVVSRGGNLLLDIGPDADGLIPPIMEDRLLAMGRWLAVNGEAIYGTTSWDDRPKTMAGDGVYYTCKGSTLYAIVFAKAEKVTVRKAGAVKAVSLLGSDRTISWKSSGDAVEIDIPAFRPGEAPCEHALVFKLAR